MPTWTRARITARRITKGRGAFSGRKAIITGADSGIGRAVALAYAREGADVLVSYYDEHVDADETCRLVESAGRKAVRMAGDVKDPRHCRAIVETAVSEFGQVDILVNNAAHQKDIRQPRGDLRRRVGDSPSRPISTRCFTW